MYLNAILKTQRINVSLRTNKNFAMQAMAMTKNCCYDDAPTEFISSHPIVTHIYGNVPNSQLRG